MNLEEIATKADLAAMEKRIIQALATQKIEKERTLNIDEAAKYINAKGRSTMYKLTSSGELAYHKVGKSNVFRIADLDRYLESKRKSSVNEIREKVCSKKYTLKQNSPMCHHTSKMHDEGLKNDVFAINW